MFKKNNIFLKKDIFNEFYITFDSQKKFFSKKNLRRELNN